MSKSLKVFYQAISEAKELLDCYDKLNHHQEIIPPDALKKASLIMALTSWETYIEDVVKELFDNKFSVVKGSTLGNFAQKQLDDRLKQFHNPDSRKTKHLFEEFFGVDITENWTWNNMTPKAARTQLNKWISIRGEAVHRVEVEPTQPHIVRKDELAKCIRFIEELVKATDSAIDIL